MKFLLDSNIVSEPTKAAPHCGVMAWLDAHDSESAISTITLAELRHGIERLPDGKRRRQFEREYSFLRQDLESRVLAFDEAEACEWGRYVAELERELGRDALKKVGIKDSQIAATARARGLTMVTRNVDHFPRVAAINPFEG